MQPGIKQDNVVVSTFVLFISVCVCDGGGGGGSDVFF